MWRVSGKPNGPTSNSRNIPDYWRGVTSGPRCVGMSHAGRVGWILVNQPSIPAGSRRGGADPDGLGRYLLWAPGAEGRRDSLRWYRSQLRHNP